MSEAPAADPHDLGRFVAAQAGGVYERALAELRAGRKESHWMWFIFPQLEGLGRSPTARHFAIRSRGEAAAYLAHPLLGARLREATRAILEGGEGDATAIFGEVDAAKLRSALTLFARVGAGDEPFAAALDRFFAGAEDGATVERIDPGSRG